MRRQRRCLGIPCSRSFKNDHLTINFCRKRLNGSVSICKAEDGTLTAVFGRPILPKHTLGVATDTMSVSVSRDTFVWSHFSNIASRNLRRYLQKLNSEYWKECLKLIKKIFHVRNIGLWQIPVLRCGTVLQFSLSSLSS